MLIIGITGGIGSGKSLVSEIIRKMGYPVFNSDDVARNILNESAEVISLLQKEFGEDILKNNILDRIKLAEIVFKDKERLKKLNEIIHPRVKKAFENWQKKQNSPMVFKEAAILIESGSYLDCNKIIVVASPEKLRITRVMKRDSVSEQKVLERMMNQLPESELLKFADHTIVNDGTQFIIPQIIRILEILKQSC